jgi:uncharacterized protein (DUF1330 family)
LSSGAGPSDPEYERAHLIRNEGTQGDIVIIEGVDGPQP